jgi:hypothetical protein
MRAVEMGMCSLDKLSEGEEFAILGLTANRIPSTMFVP